MGPLARKERQKEARATRRALESITKSNCQPQHRSPFLSLPTELRLQIYQLVLSQQVKYHICSKNFLNRIGHTHYATFDLSLLRTCRLVYFEARMIPIRSSTHHPGSGGLSDHYLHHLSAQQGLNMYHLHDEFHDFDDIDDEPEHRVERFLLPHLHWRRMSWTVSASYWHRPRGTMEERAHEILTKLELKSVVLPASCGDVTLELETGDDRVADAWARIVLDYFSEGLKCADGTILTIDLPRSFGYVHIPTQNKVFTVRICFGVDPVVRRTYAASDFWDCLGNLGRRRDGEKRIDGGLWAQQGVCQVLSVFEDKEALESQRPIFG